MQKIEYKASSRGGRYVVYQGTTWESAQALMCDDQLDPRDILFTPSNFLCNVLSEKVAIADHMGVPREQVVRTAAELALGFVRGKVASPNEPLMDAAQKFDSRIQQRMFDEVSIIALTNIRIQTVIDVAKKVSDGGKKALVFMPLANGSIPSALMIADYVSSEADTIVYPVRFSTHKLSENRPSFTEEEEDYLYTLASEQDRHFLVFDEDISTGTTMHRMLYHLSTYTCRNNAVSGYSLLYKNGEHGFHKLGTEYLESEVI